MSKPKSQSLFHFTKSLDMLTSILANGLYPRYCLEDMAWLGVSVHVAYPLVSFCDIPLARISEHTDFYGQYGIGLSRKWGLGNDVCPVIYSSNSSPVVKLAKFLLDLEEITTGSSSRGRMGEAFWTLAKLAKPLTGKMYVSGALLEKDFYQESEWRYTPANKIEDTVLFEDEFDKKKDEANEVAKKHTLRFLPSDIRYLFVRDDSDIPAVIDFINGLSGTYPPNDLKILASRVVSLSSVQRDL